MATRSATLPDGRTVNVEIVNGRTQTSGLPQGTVVHTDGGNFTIGGGTGGNYTTGSGSRSSSPSQTYAPGGNNPENLMEGGGNPNEQYPYSPDPVFDYQDQIRQMADAQRRSRIAALDKSRSNALSTLDAEQSAIGPEYYNKRNQAAARSDVGAMNFAQFMAARGIKGAAGAMPEIYRNAGLQGQIGALDQQEAANMANIARQRSNVNTAYEYDVAQANADVDSQTMQAMIDQYNQNRQYGLSEAQLTGNLGDTRTLAGQQFDWSMSSSNPDVRAQVLANKQRELELAAQEIQNSYLPMTLKLEAERLKQQVATGKYDPDIALAQLNQIRAQTRSTNALASNRLSGGSSGSASTRSDNPTAIKGTQTEVQGYVQAINAGETWENLMADYNANKDSWAKLGYDLNAILDTINKAPRVGQKYGFGG